MPRTIREVFGDYMIAFNGNIIRRSDSVIVGRIEPVDLRSAVSLAMHSIGHSRNKLGEEKIFEGKIDR